ncbi:MAG TPA: alpha/beta hydrolase [Anaerolineaceae bacterium]|nr:alpha/beta hydrolase [Anaerolineaceae bacterium]HPN53824.1 alpha/beta hydrolase [Anaerolineaceae bacterium]
MSLYVYETGPVSAPSIVFLHGGGGAGWMWKPQLAQLTDFHCLVPDLPEQGQSVDEKPFNIEGAARLVAELIRKRAHGGRACVVGLSEGAQVTVSLLSQAPDCAERAIVSSALVRPIPGAGMITPGLVGLSFRWFVTPFKNNDGWVRLNMKYSAGVPDAYFEDFRRSFQGLTEQGFVNMMMENQRFRIPAGLERAQAPVLFVCGKKEYAAMRQSAVDLARAVPNGKAYQVVHAKKMTLAEEHNWNMTAPDLFNQMVRAWCAGSPLPPELQPLE